VTAFHMTFYWCCMLYSCVAHFPTAAVSSVILSVSSLRLRRHSECTFRTTENVLSQYLTTSRYNKRSKAFSQMNNWSIRLFIVFRRVVPAQPSHLSLCRHMGQSSPFPARQQSRICKHNYKKVALWKYYFP